MSGRCFKGKTLSIFHQVDLQQPYIKVQETYVDHDLTDPTMNVIKQARQDLGYTQIELVERSGLSLRTIQRLEAGNEPPKGHSLKMLAEAFALAPAELSGKFAQEASFNTEDQSAMKLINLSVLAFFIFPFGNIFLPFHLWRKNRESKAVDEMGRKILSVQVCWTVTMCFALIVSPFIAPSSFSAIPLILYVLFAFLVLNVVLIYLTARSSQRGETSFLRLPVSLF
jgi:transcriptional regulator with XRE-family HTH domain